MIVGSVKMLKVVAVVVEFLENTCSDCYCDGFCTSVDNCWSGKILYK